MVSEWTAEKVRVAYEDVVSWKKMMDLGIAPEREAQWVLDARIAEYEREVGLAQIEHAKSEEV